MSLFSNTASFHFDRVLVLALNGFLTYATLFLDWPLWLHIAIVVFFRLGYDVGIGTLLHIQSK